MNVSGGKFALASKILTIYFFVDPMFALADSVERQPRELDSFLKAFHANPAKVMNELPYKSGAVRPLPTYDWQMARDEVRKTFCKMKDGAKFCLDDESVEKAGIGIDDDPRNVVDNPEKMISDLGTMEKMGFMSARLGTVPWTDHYWPIDSGILGNRYGDNGFNEEYGWSERYNYVISHSAASLVAAKKIDMLSPSEKYDLLVGDSSFGLTAASWREGKSYFDADGTVESWMGICHGWAAAAYMAARPKHNVVVLAADGVTKINFYPSDIKGLLSLIWAKGQPLSRFIGNRCTTKNPQRDRNGRITDPTCFDNNPGTWHKVVVNQIGLSKRSFVLDAKFDYEVWNQPVISYSFQYFNPQTGAVSNKTWREVAVRPSAYNRDPFAAYRDARDKWIVGVDMQMSYVSEEAPTQALVDGPGNDNIVTVAYRYDLELDENGNVVGGEWYVGGHPDFLWTIPVNSKPTTYYDSLATGEWSLSDQSIPKQWSQLARSSSTRGLPLFKIVDGLTKRAQ